jgi:hypothetical protein
LTTNLALLLQSENFQIGVPGTRYSSAIRNRLYEAFYTHRHRLDISCDKCNNNLETCPKSCDELKCEEKKLLIRNRYSFLKTKDLALLPNDTPFVYFGKFRSANIVIKSSVDRDRMLETNDIIAFEIKGAEV